MLETKIDESDNAARIIVVGVGGADNNAVNHMTDENVTRVEFIGVDTDKQTLQFCKTPTAMQTDEKLTKGLGTGARPDVGEKAAEKSSEEISQALKGADMVSVTYSIGDGTGTGAAPVVAKIAENIGVPAVGVVIKPFRFEAKTRMSSALEGIENPKNSADTLTVTPNDKFLEIVDRRTTMPDALKRADEVLQQAVQGITDLINVPDLTNLDFADVQTVMIDKGVAHIGTGKAEGDDKTIETVKQAISNPLLETAIGDASHIITNIFGDTSLIETNKVAGHVQELAGGETNVIFDAMYGENAQNRTSITVIATDLDEHDASASVLNAVKEFTNNFEAKPSVAAVAIQAPYAAAPEAAATASSLYSRQNQGYTSGFNPSSSGNQSCNPSKYNPDQGYSTDSTRDPAPAPNQSFRLTANRGMQINIPDFLKNKR